MSRRLVRSVLLMLCVALFAGPGANAQPATAEAPAVTLPVDLRPHWTQGQTASYEMWQRRDTRTTMQVGPESQQVSSGSVIEGQLTWQVQRVRQDGSADCTFTYDWIRLTLTNPAGKSQVNDSRQATGDNEMVMKFLKAMTGTPFNVHMAGDGSAISATGEKDIARKGQGHPNLPDNLDLLESATDAVSLTRAPAQAEMNEKWSADFEWNHEIGKLAEATQYQLTSVEQIAGIPVATVTTQAKLKLTPDRSQFPDPSQAQVDVQLRNGSLNTQLMLDLDRHEVVGRNASRDMTIQINVTVNGRVLKRTIEEQLQGQLLRIAEQ